MDQSLADTLAGKHALVTGGTRGIGAAVALALAERGAAVTVLGRDLPKLEAVARRLAEDHGVKTCAVRTDVTDAAAVSAAIAQARREIGPIDILINNAGAADSAPFARITAESWNHMLAVNLTGPFLCTQAVLPDMIAAGWGRVVTVASTAGLTGYGYVAAYCAAKHGVVGMTRSLALEVAAKGITVNAVCPGYTETDLLQGAVDTVVAKTGRDAAEAKAAFARSNPQGRLIQPEDVAATVAWLCLPASAALTGQAISVSGGEVM